MSIYFCVGCDQYKDSDYDGYHEGPNEGYICDECECKAHEEFFRDSMDQLRKMMKGG